MYNSNTIDQLLKLADDLDKAGYTKQADKIDEIVRKIVADRLDKGVPISDRDKAEYMFGPENGCEVCGRPAPRFKRLCDKHERELGRMTREQLEKFVEDKDNQNKAN